MARSRSNYAFKVRREELIRRICRYIGVKENGDRLPISLQTQIENFPLPHDSFIVGGPDIGTYTINIIPNNEPIIEKSWGYKKYKARRHTAKHRVFIHCECGRKIPSGRFHQHKGACKS